MKKKKTKIGKLRDSKPVAFMSEKERTKHRNSEFKRIRKERGYTKKVAIATILDKLHDAHSDINKRNAEIERLKVKIRDLNSIISHQDDRIDIKTVESAREYL